MYDLKKQKNCLVTPAILLRRKEIYDKIDMKHFFTFIYQWLRINREQMSNHTI